MASKHNNNKLNLAMDNFFKGFRDPFANDPFFKDSFGNIDNMISNMRSDMMRQMNDPIRMPDGSNVGGRG